MTCILDNRVQLDQLIFFEFVQHCDIQKTYLVQRLQARSGILRLYPLCFSTYGEDWYEDYCRIKLMLHHPF